MATADHLLEVEAIDRRVLEVKVATGHPIAKAGPVPKLLNRVTLREPTTILTT